MTRVLLLLADDDTLQGYEVSGHTGYAEAGQDIVCAALSFLSITCANALEVVAGARTKVQQRDGYLRVMTADRNLKAQAILETFALGIKELSKSYPDNFRLQESKPKQ